MLAEVELRDHIVGKHLPGESAEALDMDDDLIGSGILDSLAIVQLVAHLEERCGIEVGADEITPENFGSVRRLAAYLAEKRAAIAN